MHPTEQSPEYIALKKCKICNFPAGYGQGRTREQAKENAINDKLTKEIY